MASSAYFLKPLSLCADTTLDIVDMRRTLPFLRDRCVSTMHSSNRTSYSFNPNEGSLHPTKYPSHSMERSIPTNNPVLHAGAFHTKGRPFSSVRSTDPSDTARSTDPSVTARAFHTKGRPFSSVRSTDPSDTAHSPSDTVRSTVPSDIVKRFRLSDDHAREKDQKPPLILKGRDLGVKTTPVHNTGRVEWDTIIEACSHIYFQMGGSCSEKAYQTALLYNLYDLKVPGLIERPIYITTKGMSVLAGYVDMELDSRFVLELKISPPTIVNLRKDKKQLRRYISAYKTNGIQLERAALVYFGNNEVRVVEVSVKPEDNRMVPY
jgi:hypothetical protein